MLFRRLVVPVVSVGLLAGGSLSGRALAAEAAVDPARLARVDDLIHGAIAEGKCPGAVLLVGCGDSVVLRKAYGHRSVQPDKVAMTPDTIFDLASLTKVVATATSVTVLLDRGQLNLGDRAVRWLPEFAPNGKDRITLEQLLVHRAGLVADNPLADYAHGPEEAWKRICALKPKSEPGEEFEYSDVGYIVLGEIIRRVSGMPLDEFARQNIFEPLGMRRTAYRPPREWWPQIAPRSRRNGEWMIGDVHDPRAYALGCVAGHAGLFSTADDLSRYCRMILRGGEIDGRRILSPLAVREMTRARPEGATTGVRGLGWDILTGYGQPRGDLFARYRSFGHTGFTGTCFWIDPTTGVYFILLTNAVHPDEKGNVLDLRRKVANVIASSILTDAFAAPAAPAAFIATSPSARKTPAKDTQVLTGLDVLVRDNFKLLAGRKVGVITNHTGLTRDGRHIVDLLAKAPDVKLAALFAPEHGFAGALDEKIKDEKDATTGLTIYSLYGKTQTPTDEMLQGVDTLVFDIQDVGARFYTYVATMGNCMKAAAAKRIRYVVLDRPNPITGLYVAGPVADADKFSFTAFWRLPVAHGMTMGELARMFNEEMKIGADLTVVPVEDWSRAQWYDQTGLMWVNPSPNMRNLTQAILYPGVCLIEATNMSVGRGTDEPFERFGAPWVDAKKLAAALNAAGLAGVRFTPIEFVPEKGSKLGGQKCGGVHVLVTDREAIDSVQVGVTIAWTLKSLFGDRFEFEKVNRLLVNNKAIEALGKATSPADVAKLWQADLEAFRKIRQKYLMYR